ncbi:MAG: GreA/GreB family elongation factor [Planctomycetota bacterium]
MSEFLERAGAALREQRWDDFDELWLDTIEAESVPFEEYLQGAREALATGNGNRVGAVFSLLAPQASSLSVELKREYYELLVTCVPREREHREALCAVYEQELGEIPGFAAYLKTADLLHAPDPARTISAFHEMVRFRPGGFVFHRSGWGVGEILRVDPVDGTAVIDFQEKAGHRVKVDALPQICDLLPAKHFRVLAWRDPDTLERMASEAPLELVKLVLRTSERPLPLSRIREALAGGVIPSTEWSRWWARQRTLIKKDPEIGVGGGKATEYFLLEGPEETAAAIERRMAGLDVKGRLRLLREAIAEVSEEERCILEPHFVRMRRDLLRHDGSLPLLLEMLLFLHRSQEAEEELPTVAELLELSDHPGDAINALARVEDQREIIELLRSQAEEGWERLHTDLLLRADDQPREYLIGLLTEDGRTEELDELAREIRRVPKKAPMYFLWLTRLAARQELELVPSLSGIPPIDLFTRAVSLLDDLSLRAEHEKSAELRLLVKRYRQHLANRPYTLLCQVVRSAQKETIRHLYRQIEAARGFSPSGQERLLATILREQPDLLARETVAQGTIDGSVIYATAAGINKVRRQLEEIRNEKLPAVFDLIGKAAEHGDLSENAEFISAIEEREKLTRRALEIQEQLDRAQPIELGEASTERVSLGSRVTLLNLESQEREIYSVLGPWDGDAADGVVSYLSPLGRQLVDKTQAQEIDVKLPAGHARYRIEAIEIHAGPGEGK